MENKKNTSLIIVIVILSLLVCGLGGFIVYDKVLTKNDEVDTNNKENEILTEENNSVDEEKTENIEYADWINYLLDQNISEIKLIRESQEENTHIEKNATIDQLKETFSKISNYNFIRYYVGGLGYTGGDILSVSYLTDDSNYIIEIRNGFIIPDEIKDKNLLKELENSVNENQNEELKEQYGYSYVFLIDQFDGLLDSYFE